MCLNLNVCAFSTIYESLFFYFLGPKGTLIHLTYGVHLRLEILPQKYHQIFGGRPKNIGRGYKFLTKWQQILQEFLKIVFTDNVFVSLTQNYQILKIFSFDPEVTNSAKRSDPKISDGRPSMYSALVIPLVPGLVLTLSL